MATIDTKVMLNLIKSELSKRGHASRLLPTDVANTLRTTFINYGYVQSESNAISNGSTRIIFMPGTSGVRVMFNTI